MWCSVSRVEMAAVNPIASRLEYEQVFCCITLQVHSSLEAVGLTAVFSTRLAERGISANVVAGYYHDHIFVQSDYAETALDALRKLSQEASQSS